MRINNVRAYAWNHYTRASRLKGATVDGHGNPASRLVFAYRSDTGQQIGATFSTQEGSEYVFQMAGLPVLPTGATAFCVALDLSGTEGADIASQLTYYQTEP